LAAAGAINLAFTKANLITSMNKERKDKHFLHKPQYEGGSTAIKKLITDNLQYPKEALAASVEGTVHLRYEIDHKGTVTGAKIISGVGYGCEEEAVRLVRLLKFQITKNRGVKAIFHKTISIHFKMPTQVQAKEVPPPTPPAPIEINYTIQTTPKESTATRAPVPEKAKSSYNYIIQLKP
jgi:protein TonB